MCCIRHSDVRRAKTTQSFAVRRDQAIYSLALTAVLVGTVLATDLLARSRDLERWLTAASSALHEKNGTLFSYTGNFIDAEERVMLDEIPRADYSRGGVYFFGASNMKWAFQTWDLPAAERRLIGNYGIGATNHTNQLRLIRYLIEQRGFLAAGDRNLVFIGVSFHEGAVSEPWNRYFEGMLRRHGVYALAPDGRITPAPLTAVERWLRIEQARCGGFVWNLARLVNNWVNTGLSWARRPSHDWANERSPMYAQAWREILGPRWQQNMDEEVARLRETIDLARSRHATVKLILLPQGTWMDELPFKAAYEAKIRALCQTTSTPLIDLSRTIADADFVDSNHLTVEGQKKFEALIMRDVLEHLRRIGG